MTPQERLAWLQISDEREVGSFLASEVRAERVAAGRSQEEFAAAAGVALRTYKRFEADGSCSLATFVRILGALGRKRHLLLLFDMARTHQGVSLPGLPLPGASSSDN